VEKLTDQTVLKDIAEILFTKIMKTDNDKLYYTDVQNQISALISIAKRYPQLIKENWAQVSNKISSLKTSHHTDLRGAHMDIGGISYSDCHRDSSSHDDSTNYETAADYGLVFPPYPFKD
jgi:hypothetical protein